MMFDSALGDCDDALQELKRLIAKITGDSVASPASICGSGSVGSRWRLLEGPAVELLHADFPDRTQRVGSLALSNRCYRGQFC